MSATDAAAAVATSVKEGDIKAAATATTTAATTTDGGASKNPRVFFDITIGGSPVGRIVMEVSHVIQTHMHMHLLLTCMYIFALEHDLR